MGLIIFAGIKKKKKFTQTLWKKLNRKMEFEMVFIIVTPFNFIFVKNVLEKAKSISNLGNFERLNPREISWNCRFAKLVSGEN